MADLRKPIAGLVAGVALLATIAGYEGQTTRAVIPLPGDVPTICSGTTRYPDGRPVKMGDTATPEQCADWLRLDVGKFEGHIKQCVSVPLHQYEYDAYVSLAYNIGGDAFCRSTLVRRLNARDYAGACAEILKWDKFKGKPLRGLSVRRQAEYRRCLGKDPSQALANGRGPSDGRPDGGQS